MARWGGRKNTWWGFCLLALGVMVLPVGARADFEFDPGTFSATVAIPGHTVTQLQVTGTAELSGQTYTAFLDLRDPGGIAQFSLQVEGGLDWTFQVMANHRDGDRNGQVIWWTSVTIPSNQVVSQDFRADETVSGALGVTGEVLAGAYLSLIDYSSGSGKLVSSVTLGSVGGGTYLLPVPSRAEPATYQPRANLSFGPGRTMNVPLPAVTVSPGQSETVDVAVTPGYIIGTVTVLGGGLSYGAVSASYSPSSGEGALSNGPLEVASDGSSGTYRLPVVPGFAYELTPYVYVLGALQPADPQTLVAPIAVGATEVVDWTLTAPGGISGLISVPGVTLNGVYVVAKGPGGAQSSASAWNDTGLPDPQSFSMQGIATGNWGITGTLYRYPLDANGIETRVSYEYPSTVVEVDVPPGQTVDLPSGAMSFTPGFLAGSLLDLTEAAIAELTAVDLWVYPFPMTFSEGRGVLWNHDKLPQDSFTAGSYLNTYWTFLPAGDWHLRQVNLRFDFKFPDDDWAWATLQIAGGGTEQIVVAGQTTTHSPGYRLAQIRPYVQGAPGTLISEPEVRADYLRNLDGVKDRTVTARGKSYGPEAVSAQAKLYLLPGVYSLTAKAKVSGTVATIGEAIEVTVHAGDVIETDLEGPLITVVSPVGGAEISSGCVEVTGTAIDASGVSSLTVNDAPASIGEGGSFSHQICGLAKGEQQIVVVATDPNGFSTTLTRTVVILNSAPVAALTAQVGDEGQPTYFDASGSSDPEENPLQYRFDFDGDGQWDTPWSDVATAEWTYDDDFVGMAKVEVSDGELTSVASVEVRVANAPPQVGSIEAPSDPVLLGTAVEISTTYSDPGTGDTHLATVAWGDGATDTAVAGGGLIDAIHTYEAPGVYTVTITVTDDDGDSASAEFRYVVVYDPESGKVTGGGWIDSPAGACPGDPTATGRATFGFVSQYKSGATVPTGSTQFQFKAGSLKFHSTAYQWLVVTGARAQFTGTGELNDTPGYGFSITADDGGQTGGNDGDRFRIQIWHPATWAIVYDSGADVGGGADATALGSGSIMIHN